MRPASERRGRCFPDFRARRLSCPGQFPNQFLESGPFRSAPYFRVGVSERANDGGYLKGRVKIRRPQHIQVIIGAQHRKIVNPFDFGAFGSDLCGTATGREVAPGEAWWQPVTFLLGHLGDDLVLGTAVLAGTRTRPSPPLPRCRHCSSPCDRVRRDVSGIGLGFMLLAFIAASTTAERSAGVSP